MLIELAGSFAYPEHDDITRDNASVVARLLENGGLYAYNALVVIARSLRDTRPSWPSPIAPRGYASDIFSPIVSKLSQLTGREEIVEWHASMIREQDAFLDVRKRGRRSLRDGLPPGAALSASPGIAATISQLEATRWAQERAVQYAAQTGRKMRTLATLDAYGPLGRWVRGDLALIFRSTANTPTCGRRKEKRSDYLDLHHVIIGGMIKRFVSDDEGARTLFDDTWPERGRKALGYDGFRERVLRS